MPRNDQGLVAAIAADLAQLVFERCERQRFLEASACHGAHFDRVNLTVTVMMTGTGTPLSSVGVNSH